MPTQLLRLASLRLVVGNIDVLNTPQLMLHVFGQTD